MTAIAGTRVSVKDIPNLDPERVYTPVPERTEHGVPQVRLPSGHLAAHLTRFADVRAVLIDPTFSRSVTNVENGPGFLPTITPPELLINLDVPDHGRMRGLVSNDYSAAGVEALRPMLDAVIDERLAALRAQDQPDLFATVLDPIPATVNCHLLGIPLADLEIFRPSARIVQLASSSDIPGLVEHFFHVYGYVNELVAGARPVNPDGLIARLVADREQSDPPLTDADIAGLVLASLLGGDQNSLSVLSKAIYALLVATPLWQRLRAEPAILPAMVEELTRLLPLGQTSAFVRVATRETRTTEGRLPEGSLVYPNAFLANRDQEVYPDPEIIDPDRNGKRHLQFGYGMHHCLGAALARMELTAVIGRLIEEFPNMSLAADPRALPWDRGILLRRPTALPVSLS
jgi:cytochrome P450